MAKRLNTEEAAAYLGREPQTLRKWRMHGRGPAYVKDESRGGECSYSLDVLKAWKADGLKTIRPKGADQVRASV